MLSKLFGSHVWRRSGTQAMTRRFLSDFERRDVNLRVMCFHRAAASNNGMHPTAYSVNSIRKTPCLIRRVRGG